MPPLLLTLASWVAPHGQLRRPRLAIVLAGAYAVFVATYLAINVYSIGRPARVLWLPGEQSIPFLPEFEYLYVLAYGIPVIAVFRLPDTVAFGRLLLAMAFTLAIAYVTYLLFPVYLERPHLEVTSLATFLLWLEYHDPSYNHFPSLHVATVWLIYLACRPALRHPRAFAGLLVGITVSTVFVKQHYLVDVVAGIVLAVVAWQGARWIVPRTGPDGTGNPGRPS